MDVLDGLAEGDFHSFNEDPGTWPCDCGIYAIWDSSGTFVYVGKAGNLRKRLRSHASGRRSGDQFCVYVFDRAVLQQDDISIDGLKAAGVVKGELDNLVKGYVHDNLKFRYVTLDTKEEAGDLETDLRANGLDEETPEWNAL